MDIKKFILFLLLGTVCFVLMFSYYSFFIAFYFLGHAFTLYAFFHNMKSNSKSFPFFMLGTFLFGIQLITLFGESSVYVSEEMLNFLFALPIVLWIVAFFLRFEPEAKKEESEIEKPQKYKVNYENEKLEDELFN